MSIELKRAVSHPAHVPAALAFEFDMYVLPAAFATDPHAYWKAVQDTYPPIFWTPSYGGHWVALRGKDIKAIQSDHGRFSSVGEFIPKGVIPMQIPVQLDPPQHAPFRALIQPYFTPKALVELEKKARQIAIDIIEKLRPKGGCEFVSEFSGVMPVMAFLQLAGLPLEDIDMLHEWGSMVTPITNPRAAEGYANFDRYVRHWIAKRRAEPGEGVFSAIVHAKIDGKPLSDEQIYSMCLLLTTGGLDTVMLMTTYTARHLAEHPEDRKYIRENLDRLPAIVEEFARRFGTSNLSREVRMDLEYEGVRMRQGEQLMMPFGLYGLDDRIYSDPMKVDFNRAGAQHTSFGTGVHTCPGAALARREIAIFLQEWLTRIPEFRIKPGATPVCGIGLINTISNVQLEWQP